jgi:mannose-6-phosphate isomerase-like protein (cupin superfamily)
MLKFLNPFEGRSLMERKLRRIITGHNDKGKSFVAYDGPSTEVLRMWTTDRSPADNEHKDDAAIRRVGLKPPSNGSTFGFFRHLPIDPSKSDVEIENFKRLMMHKTKTVDYIILLEGELTLILEEEEVDLKPFDVVIQRGTNHGWINKGSKPALIAAVMIDAEPI